MSQEQYQIPQGSEVVPDQPLRQETGAFSATPETTEALLPYETIKLLEQTIESYRTNATWRNLPQRDGIIPVIGRRTKSLAAPHTLYSRLVDAEAEIGGRLVPSLPGIDEKLFFYEQGSWYLTLKDKQGSMIAEYRFSANSALKSSNGRIVPFFRNASFDEEKNVIMMIERYGQAIEAQMYARTPAQVKVNLSQDIDEELDQLLVVDDVRKVLTETEILSRAAVEKALAKDDYSSAI